MSNMIDLRWCISETCDVSPHVENCPECFGFGHRVPTGIIRATAAAEWGDDEYRACDVCGGSPKKEDRINIHSGIQRNRPIFKSSSLIFRPPFTILLSMTVDCQEQTAVAPMRRIIKNTAFVEKDGVKWEFVGDLITSYRPSGRLLMEINDE